MSGMFRGVKALVTGKYRFGQLWNWYKAHNMPLGLKVNHDPPRLGVFVTTKCNMKCNFCLTHSEIIEDNEYKYQGADDMSLETFKDVLDKYPHTLIVSFIGNGEPLLSKNIWDMVEYARKRKMGSTLFTNGLVLDRQIDKILNSKGMKTFNISMNGINASEYERFTGYKKQIFDKVLANTKKLCKAKKESGHEMEISATILVDKFNYQTMEEQIMFAHEIGLDHIILSHFMPWEAEGMTAEERCLFEDNVEVMDYLNSLYEKDFPIAVTFPTIFDGKKDNALCKDNVLSMSVDGDGNISGCERKMLNTEENGKYWDKDAFNNKHFQYLRKLFVTKEQKIPEPCEICFNNTTCETVHKPASEKASAQIENPKQKDAA